MSRVPNDSLLSYFPTPPSLIQGLRTRLLLAVKKRHSPRRTLRVLDLFAGDGRLGRDVVRSLVSNNIPAELTAVELDPRRASPQPGETWLLKDAFKWHPTRNFDLVVSNPPFRSLVREQSKLLDVDWDVVAAAGRNLFGLGMLRCFELCLSSGLVGIIGPFSWTTGEHAKLLRQEIVARGIHLQLYASPKRNLFSEAIQDIAIGIASFRGTRGQIELRYRHQRASLSVATTFASNGNSQGDERFKVRVGGFVWNRNKRVLSSEPKKNARVIYGWNIDGSDRLRAANATRKSQQFATPSKNLRAMRLPVCILVRRVMRGGPGNWRIDAIIWARAEQVFVENHVLIVTPPKSWSSYKTLRFIPSLKRKIAKEFSLRGQPSLGAKAVESLLNNEAF